MYSGKQIAVCGTIQPATRSFLNQSGAHIKTWGSIDLLILGVGHETKWKYAQALRLSIPTEQESVLVGKANPKPNPNPKSDPTITELWVDRYKPKSLAEVIGHTSQIKDLMTWLRDWPKTRGAFLSGPPGIGKTTVAHLVVRACDYELVELNASDERSAKAVQARFGEASRAHCVGKRRVILMDEVDGSDRGGIGELASILKTCAFPVICIANEQTPKTRPLLSGCLCLHIQFARPARNIVAKALVTRIPTAMTVAKIEELCENNGNDIRSIIHYLQFEASSTKDELQRVNPFSATGRLFAPKETLEDRMNLVFTDTGLVPLMVGEGYIGASTDVLRLHAAAEAMSTWDVFDTRVQRTQAWALMPAAAVSIVHAASHAGGKAPFQIFPSWLGKQSRRGKHMRQLAAMRRNTRAPSNFAMMESRDVYRQRLFRDGLDAPQTVARLVEYGLTRDDMFEALTETVFKGDEDIVAMETKKKSAITREWNKLFEEKEKEKEKGKEKGKEKEKGNEEIIDDSFSEEEEE